MNKIKKVILFIKTHGFIPLLRETYYRLYDRHCEKKLNIKTQKLVSKSNLDITNNDSVEYAPIGYNAVYSMLKKVSVPYNESVFLDYGSGKGRVLGIASAYGFKKVIGIELSKNLSKIANENILQMKNKKTTNTLILNVDAANYSIPQDVNVIYFFNPFKGETLKQVINNIKISYDQKPRKIYIMFFNYQHFDLIIKSFDWLNKISEKNYSQDYNGALYTTKN